ncbi:hypothetical protein DVH24_037785 [Malus domestica]|uniref:Uncharacterized protein n=1 Tax=Malus domestica TaxID=3750 RepID=A0A498JYT3_MALDO|nr:hypothetical protein DVH24_037785 [Malus domestica]
MLKPRRVCFSVKSHCDFLLKNSAGRVFQAYGLIWKSEVPNKWLMGKLTLLKCSKNGDLVHGVWYRLGFTQGLLILWVAKHKLLGVGNKIKVSWSCMVSATFWVGRDL